MACYNKGYDARALQVYSFPGLTAYKCVGDNCMQDTKGDKDTLCLPQAAYVLVNIIF